MTAISNQPTNYNYLSSVHFQVLIHRAPNFNFFVQSVTLPGMQLPRADVGTPFINMPIPGDRIIYEDLTFRYKIDEKLASYNEFLTWFKGVGFPVNFEQYADYVDGQRITSDISVIIHNSSRLPQVTYTYKDCWPTSMSSIDLSSTASDTEYIDSSVTFAFTDFEIAVST